MQYFIIIVLINEIYHICKMLSGVLIESMTVVDNMNRTCDPKQLCKIGITLIYRVCIICACMHVCVFYTVFYDNSFNSLNLPYL